MSTITSGHYGKIKLKQKEEIDGYQYKTIDRTQWDQNGNKIYMTWEELEKTL